MIAASLLPSRRVSVNGKVGDGRASSAPRGAAAGSGLCWVGVLSGLASGLAKAAAAVDPAPLELRVPSHTRAVSACVFEAPILGKVGEIAPKPFLAS